MVVDGEGGDEGVCVEAFATRLAIVRVECGGKMLVERGGEGGRRVLCLQVSIIDIRYIVVPIQVINVIFEDSWAALCLLYDDYDGTKETSSDFSFERRNFESKRTGLQKRGVFGFVLIKNESADIKGLTGDRPISIWGPPDLIRDPPYLWGPLLVKDFRQEFGPGF
ncbi:hypothetical protein Tco_1108482 [Tanacetum coccineum]